MPQHRPATQDIIEDVVVALRKRRQTLTQVLGPRPNAQLRITLRPNASPENIAVELHNVQISPHNTT